MAKKNEIFLVEEASAPLLVENQSEVLLIEETSNAPILIEETTKKETSSASVASNKQYQTEDKESRKIDAEVRRLIETGNLYKMNIKPKGHFIIPEGTKRIGPRAFYECDKLVSIEIPQSVKKVGNEAFYHCKQLSSVVLPEGVESIGIKAFYCCTNLISIEIPASVTKIEDEAFYLCRKLETIIVPKGKIMAFRKMCPRDSGRPKDAQIIEKGGIPKERISDAERIVKEAEKKAEAEAKKIAKFKATESWLQTYCIENDSSISIEWTRLERRNNYRDILEYLQSINAPQFTFTSSGITYVIRASSYGEIMITKYYSNESLQREAKEQILIDKKRKQIENDSYSSVYKEEVGRFVIPEGTKRIGNKVFFECAKLRAISIPNSVTSVGDEAFSKCARLESIHLPNNVTSLGRSAFYGCRELASIDLGDSLTKIENYTFAYCSKLTSIVLPNSVTAIDNSVFEYCSELKSITLPLNLDYIGDRVFNGCRSLEEIIVPKGKKEEYMSLLKYNYLSNNIRVIEKNYSSRQQSNRGTSHESSSKKQSGGLLSRLWSLLTED